LNKFLSLYISQLREIKDGGSRSYIVSITIIEQIKPELFPLDIEKTWIFDV